jgi:hypothetical protein
VGVRNAIRQFKRLRQSGLALDYYRYALAETAVRLIYPKYKFSEFSSLYLDDREFLAYYERFEGTSNYHSLDRKYTLAELLKLIGRLPGDTAECGALRGASSYLIARSIAGSGKRHHIFDSFSGLSKPAAEDGSYWLESDLAVDESVIRKNLKEFECVSFYKGWIPERFHEISDRRFCFVHIDVDLYQPTLDSLEFFYPRMVPGGLIVCDDYGFRTCPGARNAVNGFFEDKPEAVISLTSGQGLVIRALS